MALSNNFLVQMHRNSKAFYYLCDVCIKLKNNKKLINNKIIELWRHYKNCAMQVHCF